ncbi:hypothetical protein QYF36_001151 [Acer negundo]|nr:hypothetical protein QYF36_001151 [Acer negundo]
MNYPQCLFKYSGWRLNYGFNGYEVPAVPRASRSPRGRVPIRKKRDDNRIRAIEILACVAGKLLQDAENSSPDAACREEWDNIFESTIKCKQGHHQRYNEDEAKVSKRDPCEQEICKENFTCEFSRVPGLQGHRQSYKVNEFSRARGNFGFKTNSTSYFADHSRVGRYSSNSLEFFRGHVDSVIETNSEAKSSTVLIRPSDKISFAPQTLDFFRGQIDSVTERKYEAKPSIIRSNKSENFPVKGSLDTLELNLKPPSPVRPESDLKASLFRRRKTCSSYSRRCANAEVDIRDADENSVCCPQPSRPTPNIVEQSIRNFSTSRQWRRAPNLNGGAFRRTDWNRKPAYCNGRPCHTRQRSQRISPYKRRMFFDRIPLSTLDGRFHHKPTFNSPYKRSNGDNCNAANGASSSATGQQALPKSTSRDCNVKLSIKSFTVPELLIDIPSTATIGSLKRAVMEAVTANLGDGLHVGVILQGKSVRDDNKTLLQTGIYHDDDHRSLGFILEPNHAPISSHPQAEDPHLLSGSRPQDLMRRTTSLTLQPKPSDFSSLPPVMNLCSSVDNNFDVVCSLTDISTNNAMPNSQALFAVPAITMEALPVVPLQQKPRHPEFVQRRTRRPFSVSEVEALVQAVEKLGTGRWRDVKIRAFESAKHRTYVDLKDKWKTLVHTARISPQQRRGEPVPQQLLDRVLAAHAFWVSLRDLDSCCC